MDGTPARSGLSFALATRDDDATLRALLRENPMPSWITLTLEREPTWFASSPGREWAVIAREGVTPVGMFGCHEHLVHLNGEPSQIGYLHSLRVAPMHRHRLRVLRGGFETLRKLRQARGPELWYTSIASENAAARRLLEANLPGMPRYTPAGDLVTLAIATSRGRKRSLWQRIDAAQLARACDFYNAQAREHQFSTVLSPELAQRCGADFFVVREENRIVATMALWNRQAEHQAMVRGYRAPLGMLRPAYNLFAGATRRVPLPSVGDALDLTYLSFFAVAREAQAVVEDLVADALALASTKILMLALHDAHPWLPRLRTRFAPQTYDSRIYAVDFGTGPALDASPAQPEVALL